MYKGFRIVILLTTIFAIFIACESNNTDEKQTDAVEVLPFPNKILKRGGAITFSSNFWVVANVSDSVSSELAAYLVKRLKNLTGRDAGITDLYSTRRHTESIKIELDNNIQLSSVEAYTLDITSSHVKIKAKSANGIYYGIQTLMQLLESGASNDTYVVPKIVVKDSPNFLVRGITINQSNLNNLSTTKFFKLLGAIKINSIFVIADAQEDKNTLVNASQNYIKMYEKDDMPNDIMLLSFDESNKEIEEFYNSIDISSSTKGIVFHLTSTTYEDLIVKLAVIAEISWTDKENHNFVRTAKLIRQVSEIN